MKYRKLLFIACIAMLPFMASCGSDNDEPIIDESFNTSDNSTEESNFTPYYRVRVMENWQNIMHDSCAWDEQRQNWHKEHKQFNSISGDSGNSGSLGWDLVYPIECFDEIVDLINLVTSWSKDVTSWSDTFQSYDIYMVCLTKITYEGQMAPPWDYKFDSPISENPYDVD